MWMCKVHAVEPDAALRKLLPGAEFSDAFSISTDEPIDARRAAERMMTRAPGWVDVLLILRNIIVAPFGLKGGPHRSDGADIIGIFPVLSQTHERLVAGFDDKHLDFRVIVDVFGDGNSRRVTATTVVQTHNLLGRVYLATIKPIHRIVVQSMLRQVSR